MRYRIVMVCVVIVASATVFACQNGGHRGGQDGTGTDAPSAKEAAVNPEALAQAYDSASTEQERSALEPFVLGSEAWVHSAAAKEMLEKIEKSLLREIEKLLSDRERCGDVYGMVAYVSPGNREVINMAREILADPDIKTWQKGMAIQFLSIEKDTTSIPVVAKLLTDPVVSDSQVGYAATFFLGHTRARDALLSVVKACEADERVARHVPLELLTIEVGNVRLSEASGFLEHQATEGEDEWERVEAAAALLKMGNREHASVIEKAAEEWHENCIDALCRAIPLMDFAKRKKLTKLVREKGLAGKDNISWLQAVRCLVEMGEITPEEVTSLVLAESENRGRVNMVLEEDIQVRAWPEKAVEEMMPKVMEEAYKGGGSRYVSALVAKFGGDFGFRLLREKALGADDWQALVAAAALLELGCEDAKSVVLRGMKSQETNCRKMCAAALSETARTADMWTLVDALKGEKDLNIRLWLIAGFLRLMDPYPHVIHNRGQGD